MPDFGESELLRTVHGTFPLFDKQDPARMEAGSDHTFYFLNLILFLIILSLLFGV